MLKIIKRCVHLIKAQHSKKYNAVRYGSRYKRTCALSHQSTDFHCVVCGEPSEEFHHLHYWSLSQLIADVIDMINGRYEYEGLPGEISGRERIGGWFADGVPVCRHCHQLAPDNLHSPGKWRSSKLLPVLFNRNTFTSKWLLRYKLYRKQGLYRRLQSRSN